MIVTPWQIFFGSSDPEGIYQVTHQRYNFPKPIEVYAIVDIFGKSIISSEGEDWRRQRKVLSMAFTEKSNIFVWQESLRHAIGIMRFWSRQPNNTLNSMKVKDGSVECAQLALNIISGAGFGVKQLWNGDSEEELGESIMPGFNTTKLAEGHSFAFKQALDEMIHGVLWMMILPKWLLSE